MRIRRLWLAGAAAIMALPALAQQAAAPQPASAPPAVQPTPTQAPTAAPAATSAEAGGDESAVEEVSNVTLQPPTPPVEYPGWARRNPWSVGALAPGDAGLGDDAWGDSNGAFLSTVMRRM